MTKRLLRLAAIGVCVAAAWLVSPTPARAGFPFTEESWVDPCVFVCPAGDTAFTVFARRGGQWSGDPIWVDFCSCPGVVFGPLDGTEPYQLSGCTAVRSTPVNFSTLFEFPFKAGGVCTGNIVISIFIPDNFVRTAVASPDQNGDLFVDGDDLAIAQAKVGTSDPTADFNCDGAVTTADLVLQEGHLGHGTGGALAVPAADLATSFLSPVTPTPARSSALIRFTLAAPGPVSLAIYDLHGRMVARLLDDAEKPAGQHDVWVRTAAWPSGAYFCRLQAGATHAIRKMLVVN